MSVAPAAHPRSVTTGADLGPEHQGCFVKAAVVVTEENEAKGLGAFGQQLTVIGIVCGAERTIQPVTGDRVTRLILRIAGHDQPMAFNLGTGNPACLIDEG